jgi:transposase InsO family protein
MRVIHGESKRSYGSIRIRRDLLDEGFVCNHKRIERLMREGNLRAKAARRFKATTDSAHKMPVAANELNRNFAASAPNQVWVTDITYVWTREGWMYLCVFIDLFSRMVVGWALSTRMTAALPILALERAFARRKPPGAVLVHSDRGSQYASQAFQDALALHGGRSSMSRKGNCWDNAVAESFFHSFKVEAIYGEDLQTRREVELATFEYIEKFYNQRRRHSANGQLSPVNYERGFKKAA